MKINDSILFWKYPDSISKKVKGVSYKVISCVSTFSNGSFKQLLECVINDFGDATQVEAAKAAEEFSQRNEQLTQATDSNNATGTNPGDATTTSEQTTGTTPDKPVPTSGNTANAAPATNKTAAQGTTTAGVANDDSASTNTKPTVPTTR
jgi:L-fucose isomerase-like protein